MATSTFVLKEPKSTEETLTYLLFRHNGQKLKYSTGIKINPKFWNPDKQRAKETRQFPQYAELNASLLKIENTAFNIHRRFFNDGITPTLNQFRDAINEALDKKEGVAKKDLIEFAEEIIKNSIKRPNTIKHYNQTLRQLKAYKAEYRKELSFESIDLDFYDDFVKYLQGQGYGVNTIGGYIKNLKVFMNEAFDRGITQNLQFKNRKFKTVEEESENIYLTVGEISQLYKLDLSHNARLERVRDLFIIGCYTGLRFSDLSKLKEENSIDNGTKIKIKTEKTGELVIIPLHPYIREIFIKYNGTPPNVISNQKMNDYLKELGDTAEMHETIYISSTKGGKVISTGYKKYELITVHTARRSFATNAYLNDVPSISIMKITGHRTEKAFLKYIKMSQEDNANKLLNHPFFS